MPINERQMALVVATLLIDDPGRSQSRSNLGHPAHCAFLAPSNQKKNAHKKEAQFPHQNVKTLGKKAKLSSRVTEISGFSK